MRKTLFASLAIVLFSVLVLGVLVHGSLPTGGGDTARPPARGRGGGYSERDHRGQEGGDFRLRVPRAGWE